MFVSVILLAIVINCVHAQVELTVPPLPYAYDALEPVLSAGLMHLHYDNHFRTYMNYTNVALRALLVDTQVDDKVKEVAKLPIETILTRLASLPDRYNIGLRHNGGGYYNHKLFFSMLRSPTATAADNRPTGPLFDEIEKRFGSFEQFKELFTGASVNLFGSGWVWLYIDSRTGQLVLNFTANQDNPIMFDKNHVIILGIDLWEHAYYPVYQYRRNEYVENFWRIINWPHVTQLFTEGQIKRTEL